MYSGLGRFSPHYKISLKDKISLGADKICKPNRPEDRVDVTIVVLACKEVLGCF
jgi:hypothetical protein